MTKIKSLKRITLSFCLMALCIVTFGALSLYSQKTLVASAAGEIVVTAQLMDTRVTKIGDAFQNTIGTEPTVIESISDGETVVLENTDAYDVAKNGGSWTQDGYNGIKTQAVRLAMGTADSSVQLSFLSTTATINGKSVSVPQVGVDNSFELFIFGLPNELYISDINNNLIPLEETYGRFILNYRYRVYNASTGTDTERSGSFAFNLLTAPFVSQTNGVNAWDYENLYRFVDNAGSATIEGATRDDTNLFFNYNNFTSEEELGALEMPVVRYDATKYTLAYTRKVYNSLETVTSQMTATKIGDTTGAVVTFTSTLDGVTENFTYEIANLNADPFVELKFEDIGEYQFTLSLQTRVDDITFMPVLQTNSELLNASDKTKSVTIFGYQLKYANGASDSAELRNEELGLYSDITNLNETIITTGLSTELIGSLNFFEDASDKVSIPSTNQAPLWFDYIGTLNLVQTSKYYYFSKTSTMDYNNLGLYTPTSSGEYKKGEYFMNAGLYIVEINYTLASLPFSGVYFKQLFAFEISNTAPSAEVIALGDNTRLYNDAFTNQNVAVNWDISNPFDAPIVARYDRYDFQNRLIVSNGNVTRFGESNQTTFNRSGKYYVKLYYGRFNSSYTVWEFTIDKDPISNLQINFADSWLKPAVDATSLSSTNEPFTLTWDSKASGAKTSVEHQQMLLIKDTSYIVNSLSNLVYLGENQGNKVYALKNGYKTSTLSSAITYENTQSFNATQYAMHFFRIFDEAGNERYYAILLDNTNPTFIFDPKIENKYNIIKDTTSVIWGNSKAISFEIPTLGANKLFDYFVENDALPSICDQENGIINIGFTNIDIHYANLQSGLVNSSTPANTPAMQVQIDTAQKTITPYLAQIDISSGSLNVITNASPLTGSVSTDLEEYFYSVDLVDNSTKPYNNYTSGKSSTLIEVNLDASQVLAFTDDNADIRLYNGSASNRDKVYVNYYATNGEFVVESLTLEYYPLAMDKSLNTYPYLNTPTMTVDLLASAVYDSATDKMRTDYFNLTYSSALEREVTQAGKYVVTRTYEYNSSIFESEDDAKRTKQYTYIVDRNDIVQQITVDYPIEVDGSQTFLRTVGEYIKLVLGTSEQNAEFTNLLLSSSSANGNKNVILETDLLPVNPYIPTNKYVVLGQNDIEYTEYNSFNLNLTISYNEIGLDDSMYSPILSISANNASEVANALLLVDPMILSRIGWYKFTLTDNTGYTLIRDNVVEYNTNPNNFEFCIHITKQAPTGSYFGTPNTDGSDKEISSTGASGSLVASSSDDELKFVFEETTNIYKTKVNYVDVVVSRRARGTTRFDTAVTVRFQDATYDEDGEVIYPSSTELTTLEDVVGIRERLPELDSLGNKVTDPEGNVVYKTDANGNFIYKYSVIMPTKTRAGAFYEGEYRVTIHYYGDENYYYDNTNTISYYRSSVSVVLDHTAPNFNLLRLVYADKYLPESSADPSVVSKQDIVLYAKNALESNPTKKEQVRQFLRTYAFALPSDFVFYYATNDGFPMNLYDDYTYVEHDTASIYTRKYDKYSTTSEDIDQSYIKSDPEFDDVTKLRFEVANPIYKNFSYKTYGTASQPFYRTIAQETGYAPGYGSEGYYEIIEIDQAGNQRIYTVFLKTTETNALFSDGAVTQVGNTETPSLSLGYEYTLSEIQNLDKWTRISLYDSTSSSQLLRNFVITPDTDLNTIINGIQSYINDQTSHRSTGAKYDLVFLNRFGDDFTISVQRPGEQLTHTIVEGTLNFEITLPHSTNSTWIERFIVKQYNPLTNSLVTLTRDLNGPISTTDFDGVKYVFNSGEYYFYMIDNFGRGETQPIHYIFNIIDAKDVEFTGTVIDNTTASDVIFTYQTRLYTAEVYVNGNQVDNSEAFDFITITDNSSTYIRTFHFPARNNTRDTYHIVLNYNTGDLDISTEPITFDFVIDKIMPNFELTDANGNNMNYLLSGTNASTSKEVYINWGQATNFDVTVTVKKDNNSAVEIERGYSLFTIGTYTITMTNTLGNSVSYTFSISQNAAVLYDVFANGDKIEPGLNSAHFAYYGVFNDEAIDINEYLKVFVSIYPLSVVANEKKDLQAKLIFEYTSTDIYTLKVYQIVGSSSLYYSEYIALLQIDESILRINNFMLGESSDIMSFVAGYSTTFFSENVYANWQKSLTLDVIGFDNLTFEDFIYVDLYYNNQYVSRFESNTIHFTDSGEYRLYFSDIAGFKYKFTSGLNVRAYYTIDLLNSVSFLVNDGEPINYAIYNSSVKFAPTNTSRYDAGSFSMKITLDGKELKPSDYRANGVYTFKDYGAYKITMSATINGTAVSSEYNFTILSSNEARTRFHFNKYDSFEIISITKDGIDILEQLKAEQMTTKLMELDFFTSNEDQIGKYDVVVRVTPSSLKPVQEFAFSFWINEADLNLMPSIPFGTSTTNKITIKLNKYAIHQELGNVVIKVTGMDDIVINEQTASVNEVTSFKLTKNQTYLIQAYTESGRLLASYVITKDEPLNTISIILIVVAVVIVVAIIVLFIVFRTRMKVR